MSITFHIIHKKWHARINYNGKVHHLGYFKTKEEAEKKVDEYRKELEQRKKISNLFK